jgi:hypothetical protein
MELPFDAFWLPVCLFVAMFAASTWHDVNNTAHHSSAANADAAREARWR